MLPIIPMMEGATAEATLPTEGTAVNGDEATGVVTDEQEVGDEK